MATTKSIAVAWNLKQYIDGKGSTWHSVSLDTVQGALQNSANIPNGAIITNARLTVKAAFDGGLAAQVYLSAGFSTSTSSITNKFISSTKISKTSTQYYSGYILSSLFSNTAYPFTLNRSGSVKYITCEIQSANVVDRNHYVDEIAIEVTYDIPSYKITTNVSGSGSVSGGGTYTNRTSVTLTATANSGHKFIKWQDGSTANPRTITVTGNATYTAYFEIDKINVVLVDNTKPTKILIDTQEVKAILVDTTKVYG